MSVNNKLGYIDALRGYAILLVIFAHNGQMYPKDYPAFLQSLINFGPRGVELFFLVSALTLFLSTEKRFLIDKRPIISFFLRRFFRIAPLFYCGLVFYNVLLFSEIPVSGILSNIFFVASVNPYWHALRLVPGSWSISAEMIFYLIFPLLFIKIRSFNSALNFTLFSFLLSFIIKIIVNKFSFGVPMEIWEQFRPYIFPFTVPVFGIGLCFYFVIFKQDSYVKSSSILLLSLITLLTLIYEVRFIYTFFIVVMFGFIALSLSKRQNKFIENRLVKYFGKISFSMYMVHFGVIRAIEYFGLLKHLQLDDTFSLLVYFACKLILIIFFTTIISIITYSSIEVMGQSLGRKVIKLINSESKSVALP